MTYLITDNNWFNKEFDNKDEAIEKAIFYSKALPCLECHVREKTIKGYMTIAFAINGTLHTVEQVLKPNWKR